MENMKIMYMGTPDFAAHILKSLISDGYNVTSVVTKTDAKKDRGHHLVFKSPWKVAKNNKKTTQIRRFKWFMWSC